MHELDSTYSGSTLFNTVVAIGDDGAILNTHRKLMPTNPERMVWGAGDASGLRVVWTRSSADWAACCAGKTTCRSPVTRFMHSRWTFWWR